MVEAEPQTNRTIILTGHIDVVDTKEARSLEEVMFDPEEYTKRIKELDLPEEAAKDLESGDYLFGRGVMDMKAGIAIHCLLYTSPLYAHTPQNALRASNPSTDLSLGSLQ